MAMGWALSSRSPPIPARPVDRDCNPLVHSVPQMQLETAWGSHPNFGGGNQALFEGSGW